MENSNNGKLYEDLPEEFIKWAYRLFLDREVENQDAIEDKKRRIKNCRDLRDIFLNSEEFKAKNQWHKPLPQLTDKSIVYVEHVAPGRELALLFNHIQNTWSYLGKTEPHWSVLSAENFKQDNISQTINLFNETGKNEVSKLFASLDRNQLDYKSFKSAIEYGCGVGRVTRWLAEKFEVVYGYDISSSHLKVAHQYMTEVEIQNVQLNQLVALRDLKKLPQVDFIYSVIVLQHNPPPIITFIIKQFMNSLNSGGVAFFQVPTYKHGYKFSLKEYLNDVNQEVENYQIEMHILPQKDIFTIIRQMDAKLIEVTEDNWAGEGYISNTFIVQKN